VAAVGGRTGAAGSKKTTVGTPLCIGFVSLFASGGLVARRARQDVRGDLRPSGACQFTGTLQLPERGRWFVYLELTGRTGAVEVWLPVIEASGQHTYTKTSWIYIPPKRTVNALALSSGAIIYAISVGLFGLCVIAFRRTRAERAAGGSGPAALAVRASR